MSIFVARVRPFLFATLTLAALCPLVAACTDGTSDGCVQGDTNCTVIQDTPDASFDVGQASDGAALDGSQGSSDGSIIPADASSDSSVKDGGVVTNGLPPYPYCYCLNHKYAEDEIIRQADGTPKLVNGSTCYAHFTRSIMWAAGEGAYKPGAWLIAGGWIDRCAMRFSNCDPSDASCNGNPVLPPVVKQYADGELVCRNDQQGWIFSKKTADGRKYLCRKYDDQITGCGYVPGGWATSQCNVSVGDAQQFDLDDPNKFSVCP